MPISPEAALRLFIAVELPEHEVLEGLQKRLRAFDRENVIRWVQIDSVHLTLKFLGEVPAAQVGAIRTALIQAAQGHTPFDLTIIGAGCFPNMHRPRVVWAGIGGNTNALHKLRDSVEQTVSPLGYPTEPRPFSPHLTLGRTRQGLSASALGAHIEQLDVGQLAQWRVEALSLMQSNLTPTGAIYTRLAHVSLASA